MDTDDLLDDVVEAIAATDLARAVQLLERAADEETDDAHQVTLSLLWEDVADAYADRARYDDAIATIERCLELEYASDHDLRGTLASYRFHAGDEEGAVELWDTVTEENPDDVLVRLLAGVAYHDAERHQDALEWFDDALTTVLRRGDREGLLADILELREETLAAVGEQPDDLQERGRALFGQQVHQLPGLDPTAQRRTRITAAFAWFPRSEWNDAVDRWPDIGQDHRDYQAYARGMQLELLRFDEARDSRPSLSPLFLDAYLTWAEANDKDPGLSSTRATYAAEVARLGNEVPWPPRRNDPCWCGSGTKYKKCCGTVRLT